MRMISLLLACLVAAGCSRVCGYTVEYSPRYHAYYIQQYGFDIDSHGYKTLEEAVAAIEFYKKNPVYKDPSDGRDWRDRTVYK